MNYIYKLVAYKDGKKTLLAEYRGDDTGLYRFEIEREPVTYSGVEYDGNEEVFYGWKTSKSTDDG